MPKPQTEPKTEDYQSSSNLLFETLIKVRDIKEMKRILSSLLTPSELRMLKRRFYIACLLQEGISVREVARMAKVGTDTVERVKKVLEKESSWVPKRIPHQEKPITPKKPRTKYIFGKV